MCIVIKYSKSRLQPKPGPPPCRVLTNADGRRRYPVSGAVTSGAVYGRRLLAEPGIPIGIAGIGPYLPPNVHVPPGGLGGFGRKLTAYYG